MASIQKRGKKYAVVYTYDDSKGEKKQKWETFITKKEALKRKAAVENEINNGTFIPPSELTVKDFLRDFVELYGTKRWGLSVYASNNGLISNYINPLIGGRNCTGHQSQVSGSIHPEVAENASNRNSIQTCTDRLCYAMHH